MVLNLGRQLGSHQTEMSRRTQRAENATWTQDEPQICLAHEGPVWVV